MPEAEITLRIVEKLGFSECDEDRHFAERLWLVYGDQVTAQMIHTVRNLNVTATRVFDRRKWILGPPALFHIQQALLFLIIRTHFDTSGSDTKTSPPFFLGRVRVPAAIVRALFFALSVSFHTSFRLAFRFWQPGARDSRFTTSCSKNKQSLSSVTHAPSVLPGNLAHHSSHSFCFGSYAVVVFLGRCSI